MEDDGTTPKGNFVLFDKCTTDVGAKSTVNALLVLMAIYYVFNLEYPKIYFQVLGIVQTYVMKDTPYNGRKSAGYAKVATKLHEKLFAS